MIRRSADPTRPARDGDYGDHRPLAAGPAGLRRFRPSGPRAVQRAPTRPRRTVRVRALPPLTGRWPSSVRTPCRNPRQWAPPRTSGISDSGSPFVSRGRRWRAIAPAPPRPPVRPQPHFLIVFATLWCDTPACPHPTSANGGPAAGRYGAGDGPRRTASPGPVIGPDPCVGRRCVGTSWWCRSARAFCALQRPARWRPGSPAVGAPWVG